jgi:hypothetical protein
MTSFVAKGIGACQNQIYHEFNKFLKCYKPRFSIPFSIIDVTLDTLKSPLHAIEEVAKIPLNLAHAFRPSSDKRAVLKAIRLNTSNAIYYTLLTPVDLLTAPIKIMSQSLYLLNNSCDGQATSISRKTILKDSYSKSHTTHLQNNIFYSLNSFSIKHPVLGRFFAIPVSLLDVTLEILKFALNIIENIAVTMRSLLGSNEPKTGVKLGLLNLEKTLSSFCAIPAKVLMAPIKFAFQTCAILIDPTQVNSINKYKYTFFG